MKKLDLVGQQFGRLTVISEAPKDSKSRIVWHCKCSCGGNKSVPSVLLVSGGTRSCGCLSSENKRVHILALNAKRKSEVEDNLPIRFWEKVDKGLGCWIWKASTNHAGYGRLNYKGVIHKAHRISYIMANGEIPHGMHVLHTCDNRLCVNPSHLFLGTQADNMVDKQRKGRAPHGGNCPQAKLTQDQVLEIREEKILSGSEIASKYGITRSYAYAIRGGRTWKHLSRNAS